MLNHGDPAIVRGFDVFCLVFFYIAKRYFAKFFHFGINRRAGKRGIKLGLALGRVSVTHQLQIQSWL